MKIYLSYPFRIREEVREWEVNVENELGVELINPFFDLVRGYLTKDTYSKVEAEEIVERDLKAIKESDAVLVVLSKEAWAGVFMEMFYASMLHKPVIMLPWIIRFADEILRYGWEVKDVVERLRKEHKEGGGNG